MHHWLIARRVEESWKKLTSAISFSFVFAVICIISLTRTHVEMIEQKITYHCLLRYNATRCEEQLASLPHKDLEIFSTRVENLQHELAAKPK